jgi:sulfhydrogenase subunit alpha
MTFLGGREIHPINVRAGGFYRVPTRRAFEPLLKQLKWGREAALETVRRVSQIILRRTTN